MKIVSDKQRKFFGAVASGSAKKSGLKPGKALRMLRENKGRMRGLPERTSTRTSKRTNSRMGHR